MSGRLTARLTEAELKEFDALPENEQIDTYRRLGSQDFELLYGKGRRINIQNIPGVVDYSQPKPQFGMGIYKDGNPKTQFGAVKPGLFYMPPMPLYETALAHMQGALKYGHFNWRDDPVSISTYADAAKRHIDLYLEGQRNASDTGIHNLAHANCCLNIIMDAEHHNTLIDDRKLTILYTNNNTGDILEGYMEETKARVTRIKKEWMGHAEAVKAGTLDEWKKRDTK